MGYSFASLVTGPLNSESFFLSYISGFENGFLVKFTWPVPWCKVIPSLASFWFIVDIFGEFPTCLVFIFRLSSLCISVSLLVESSSLRSYGPWSSLCTRETTTLFLKLAGKLVHINLQSVFIHVYRACPSALLTVHTPQLVKLESERPPMISILPPLVLVTTGLAL